MEQVDLSLPPVPTWIQRGLAALGCAVVMLLVAPDPTGAASGEHYVFNPHAQIDRTQIEVRCGC